MKILSIVLIVLGSLLILLGILSFLTSNGPSSEDIAFKIGYYSFPFLILIFGLVLLFIGIRINGNQKRKRMKKNLVDSLPN